MTRDEIEKKWLEIAKIDISQLALVQAQNPYFHNEFLKILYHEKKKLREAEKQYNYLRRSKKDFLRYGPDKDPPPNSPELKFGWRLPPKGRIVEAKALEEYLDSDPDLDSILDILNEQRDIVKYAEQIIQKLNDRQWEIRNIIEALKYEQGVF